MLLWRVVCKLRAHHACVMEKTDELEEPKEARKLLSINLRVLRAKRALSQEQLALQARVNKNYISQIETESRAVSVDIVEKLARALGVSIAAMFAPD